jgi:capping protein alpha
MADVTGIVKGFLLNAPPGEFLEVVSDVRTLLKNDGLLNSIAPATFAEYNNTQYIKVDSPKGHKVLITKFGDLGNNEYLDPLGGIAFTYDHIKQQITGSRPLNGELNAEAEPFRKAFETAAEAYAADHYMHGAQTTYSAKSGSDIVITTCIASNLFNQKNFWGGRWRSTWTFRFKPGSGQCTMEGHIQIQVHYYEEGNVQLVTDTKKTKSIPVADAAALAQAVFKAVDSVESDFQNALDNSYRTMGTTTFKALRRQLPITRSKIDWDKIMQYRTGQSIAGPH